MNEHFELEKFKAQDRRQDFEKKKCIATCWWNWDMENLGIIGVLRKKRCEVELLEEPGLSGWD